MSPQLAISCMDNPSKGPEIQLLISALIYPFNAGCNGIVHKIKVTIKERE